MNIEQLSEGIATKFKKSRIVFWHDPDKSFLDELDSLVLEGVTLLNMDGVSYLEIKKRLEINAPEESFLLYFPWEEPESQTDWLLDIRLYSETFFADFSSMLLTDLGITKMSLRSHVRLRKKFFANKQRVSSLKRFITEDEDEGSLDRKMIAVLVKAESTSISDILLCLFKEYSENLNVSDVEFPLLAQIEKFDLKESLWQSCTNHFGYDAEEPTLADFALKLFCTELWKQIDSEDCDWLSHNLLKTASGMSTALAFMVSWRDSRSYSHHYEQIASMLDEKLEIAQICRNYLPVELLDCEVFEGIEKVIIKGLVDALLDSGKVLDRVQFAAAISRRMSSYWVVSKKEYHAIYQALHFAQRLLELRHQYVDGFYFTTAKQMYAAYVDNLYQFDQCYRLFNENVHELLVKGAEVLNQLDEEIENLYTDWYLFEIGLAWDRLIEKEALMDNWNLPDIGRQDQFYQRHVQRLIDSSQIRRVFVVVSDALRYEVAEELKTVINREKRYKTELNSQLGLLPSYTQLGMAALLPHHELSYREGDGNTIYVDQNSSQGLANRNVILQKNNGLAVSYKEVMSWKNQEGRDKVKDREVVYIYHDSIDAVGDKAATEDRTFKACRDAVEELRDLVSRIVNRLNGSRVIITADHGFLFQQKSLEKSNKTELMVNPPGSVVAKKRYILGHNLPAQAACWKGKATVGLKSDSVMEYLLPKGVQRFHFVGGAKFIHGGAMLQEICIPILEVRELQKKQAALLEKKSVGVVLATSPIKIVNNIEKLRFIQTDAVNENFTARTLEIYIVDSIGEVVSSREFVSFDSTAKSMDERTRDVRIKLVGANFDRLTLYTLVLENTETKIRYDQHAVTIDLAFRDDFF
ncbi:MAG: BREX-1 system phosphatase PglZ type A [Gimesia sp.]